MKTLKGISVFYSRASTAAALDGIITMEDPLGNPCTSSKCSSTTTSLQYGLSHGGGSLPMEPRGPTLKLLADKKIKALHVPERLKA